MLNMGFSEIVFLAILALIIIGPKQLPHVAVMVGRMLNEFKRTASEVQDSFQEASNFPHNKSKKEKPTSDEQDVHQDGGKEQREKLTQHNHNDTDRPKSQ